jgi:hypothetical protein
MKIIKNEKKITILRKEDTKVGELYAVHGGDGIHLRCQGGFVEMDTGALTEYAACRQDACWVHLANAELHLNN